MDGLKELIEYGILGLLGVMSVVSLAYGIERWLTYKQIEPSDFDHRNDFEIALTKNLTIIYTIGANAVYIGLLGTVLGIMLTFSTLGQSDIVDAKSVMSSLSYTLIATAAGLLVAIPAMVIYNLLSRRVDVLLALWDKDHGHGA